MTTRMTAQRLSRLIDDGDAAAVRAALDARPGLLASPVERDGSDGWTPLHLAVAAGHPAVVEVLVTAGADVAARTEDGRTALHVALRHFPDWCSCCARWAHRSTPPARRTWAMPAGWPVSWTPVHS